MGELPFWNPYSFSGNYHIGLSETAVFYPLFFVFSILPQSFSWFLLQLSLPLIGFMGMYGFLRCHLARVYAFFGGVVFGFSGIVLVRMVEGLSVGHTLIWLPFALWGIEGFIREKKSRYLVMLAISMALSVLAGWFQFAFYLITYAALYGVWRILSNFNRQKHLNYLIFIPFIIVPLLTLFHILPAIDTLIASPRTDISLVDLEKHLLPVSHVFALFYPDFWGNPATLSFFGRSEYKESIVFIGVIPALLALVSLIYFIKHKVVIFFTLSAIAAFLLGTDNYISRGFIDAGIPIVSSFLPDRTMYLVSVSLCILSAFGLRAIIEEKKNTKIFMGLILLQVVVIIILSHRLIITFLPLSTEMREFLSYWFEPINAYFDGRPGKVVEPIQAAVQAKNVILGNIFISLFFVTFLARGILKKKGVLVIFFTATIIGQLYFGYKYIPFSYTQFIFPPHPVFSYIQQEAGINRFITTGSGYIPSNLTLPYKIYSPDGVSSMYPRRYGELVTYALQQGSQHNTPRIESRIQTDARMLLGGESAYIERFMQIDGVKYVVVLAKDTPEQIDTSYSKVWNDDTWQIFTYNESMPRVLWTRKYEVVEDQQLLKRLFDSSLPDETLLLEKNPGVSNSVESTGTAEVISYGPNKIIIKTNATGDGLVYVSDNFTHNVKAFVDSSEVELLRANFTFRAVPVKKGSHEIVLQYHDQGFLVGTLVAGSTLLVSFGGITLLRRKKIYF